jgi:hypothetical protein
MNEQQKKRKKKMESVSNLMETKLEEMRKNYVSKSQANSVTEEFQDYGLRLAHRLNDFNHKALYIKYSRLLPRAIVEDAAAFATDYPKAKNKAKLFMWKVHDLISEYNEKHPQKKIDLRSLKRKKKKRLSKKERERQENLPLL